MNKAAKNAGNYYKWNILMRYVSKCKCHNNEQVFKGYAYKNFVSQRMVTMYLLISPPCVFVGAWEQPAKTKLTTRRINELSFHAQKPSPCNRNRKRNRKSNRKRNPKRNSKRNRKRNRKRSPQLGINLYLTKKCTCPTPKITY